MNNTRKHFTKGLNADTDFSLLDPGEWINASNVRTYTTDNGATERVEMIGGNLRLWNDLPAGRNICIGGCEDDENKRLVWLNYNGNGDHGIYCYDKKTGLGYRVLLNADVVGGLGFTSESNVHSCFFANGCLYWVYGTEREPRRINVDAGIRAYKPLYQSAVKPYKLPLDSSVISWIRKPGNFTLQMTKVIQTSPELDYNYIKFGAFQFCYRYTYRDYEVSTLSAYTNLANFNDELTPYNAIDLTLPFEEHIEQDVQSIDFVVRDLLTGLYYVIKSWDRSMAGDEDLINQHNAGIENLAIRFYNTRTGYTLDNAYKILPYHSVPLYAEATEVAKDRAFMGNITLGYDTPKTTSLTCKIESMHLDGGSVTTPVGHWFTVETGPMYIGGPTFFFKVLQSSVPLLGGEITPYPEDPFYYYKLTDDGTSVPPYPDTVETADLTFVGIKSRIRSYYMTNSYLPPGWAAVFFYDDTGATSVIQGSDLSTTYIQSAFKAGGAYQIGITFYDRYMRSCGVKTDVINSVGIPEALISGDYVTAINWLLSNGNAAIEIPRWAYFYSINITKCLTTNFFLQNVGLATYATQDPVTSVYTFADTTYSSERAGIAIDLTSLLSYKMGYGFNDGDIAKISVGDVEYILGVKETSGKYAILELKNVGTLSPTNVQYEIFTPYRPTGTEPFYETGVIYPVTNPTQNNRTYSVTTGTLTGDIYLLKRSSLGVTFYAETMSPIDKFWKVWNTNTGRPNFIDTIGQVTRKDDYCFSDVFQAGTKNNGLSSFNPLNTGSIDGENGPIRYLKRANKIQLDGTVMLAICENETVSMYLGEQELLDTQGSSFVARSNNVVGTTKALSGSFGTKDPESVFEYGGLVYFFSRTNGAFVHYSNNGLFPISKNKLKRPANLFAKLLDKVPSAVVEDLGSRPFVIGGFDPHHKEALWTIPRLSATPPKGFLADYDGIIYPYDIWDAQGKTLMYKQEADLWIGSASYQAEKFLAMGNDLYSFSDGRLYIHNQNNLANFYGQQYTAKLMFAINPGAIHSFLAIGLETRKRPVFTHFRTEDPNVQSSDLLKPTYLNKEGVKYARLMRDRLTPRGTSYFQAQVNGDKMIGKALLVMLEWEYQGGNVWDDTFDDTFNGLEGDKLRLDLRFVNVSHIVHAGHLMLG